ncbi:MAG: sodium:alanine symporter family protein [Alphaproteobacteria bacterium]|nr:sodium:alanine symporter family protein [Rickettsiales bacterium]
MKPFLISIIEFKIYQLPIAIWLLVVASVYLTIKLRFINFRMIPNAYFALVKDTEKAVSKEDKKQKMSPLKAFFIQISATLGLGNISGSVFALYTGGPGVILWIIILAPLFSIVRFNEIILGQVYKQKNKKTGKMVGNLAFILSKGFSNKYVKVTGLIWGGIYSIIMIFNVSIWSGFQLNQSIASLTNSTGIFNKNSNSIALFPTILTIIMLCLVFFLLNGGIKRIANAMQTMISAMITIYFLLFVWTLVAKYSCVPSVLRLIFQSAFNFKAVTGGAITAILVGANRLVLAAEIGIGTGCIPYASFTEKYFAKQAFFGLIETVLVAFMISIGAIMLLLLGADINSVAPNDIGINLTKNLVSNGLGVIPNIALLITVFCFSFTTLVGNGYYIDTMIRFFFPNIKTFFVMFVYILTSAVLSAINAFSLISIIDILLHIVILLNLVTIASFAKVSQSHLDKYLYRIKTFKKDVNKGVSK